MAETTLEQSFTVACLACGFTAETSAEHVARCPRCDAEAIALEKGGRRVVDPRLQEAQALAGKTGIDVGFALSVLGNRMTVELAKAKGNRDATAQQLVNRYQIPLRWAYQVADEKIRPQEAVAQHAAVEAAKRKAARGKGPVAAVGMFLLAAAIFFVGYVYTSQDPTKGGTAPPRRITAETGSEVLYNDAGALIFVKAAGPAQVLNLFVRAVPKRRSIEVKWIDTDNAQGIYEELNAAGAFERRTIAIVRDAASSTWATGDRKGAIPTLPL